MLVNSQAFELTSDRNNISNQDDSKVKWVFSEIRKIIYEDIIPLANEGYFKLRKNEEMEYFIREKYRKLTERLDLFNKIDIISSICHRN